MWQIYINIRTKTFIQVIRPWAYLYKCGRPGFTVLDRMMAEFTETIWTSAQGLWGQKSKSKPARYRGKHHKTSIGDNLIWLQTFMISSSDQSLKVSAQALQQRVVRTEYHLRWRPWLQVNVNILLTNLLFPCLILPRPAGQPKAPPSLGGKGGVRQSGASSCHPEVIQ